MELENQPLYINKCLQQRFWGWGWDLRMS